MYVEVSSTMGLANEMSDEAWGKLQVVGFMEEKIGILPNWPGGVTGNRTDNTIAVMENCWRNSTARI